MADEIAKAKYKKGVTAQTTRELLETGYKATRTFFSIIDILMKMGLIVGILSLGILALRAIVERRHLIGVMRAVGYRKHNVLSGLLIESAVIATLGVLVGSAVGIGMAWLFYIKFFEEAVFGVLWSSLWGALALVYSATFLVTIGPAWRASRLPPAEAVRYVE
jgi:putative ABC transport system permease protein